MAAFQTPYRTSVVYQVSLVLIESKRRAKAPLPVLKRGEDDRGATAQADLVPPFPTLTDLLPPGDQPSARLGDVITLRGHHLDQGTLAVLFANPHLTGPVPIKVEPATAAEVKVKLLDTPDDRMRARSGVAGLYSVSLRLGDGDKARTTNELPLTIAPLIRWPCP